MNPTRIHDGGEGWRILIAGTGGSQRSLDMNERIDKFGRNSIPKVAGAERLPGGCTA